MDPANGPADNPAWMEALGGIPEEFHDGLKTHFSNWDRGVQSRIDTVHGEYADYKAFKEAGIKSDDLQQAYGIYERLLADPRAVWDALGSSYGYTQQPQAQVSGQPQGQINPQQVTAEYPGQAQYNPQLDQQYTQLKQQADMMANILLQQEQQRVQAEADANLNRMIADAKTRHGDFDEGYVVAYMQNGMNIDQAVAQYQGLVNSITSNLNRPQAPVVITGGGGGGQLPSQAINPNTLNRSQTRNLVVDILKAANQGA